MRKIFLKYWLLIIWGFISHGCTSFVEVEQPDNKITGDVVFKEEATAIAAVNGCYAGLSQVTPPFANGAASIYLGMYADEVTTNLTASSTRDFVNSTLTPSNSFIYTNFWRNAYETIYQVNRCLAGLQGSSNLSEPTKRQLLGECYFLRAFCYWYLTNLFGDIPLVTNVNYDVNSLLSRTASSFVFVQMKQDLLEAMNLLQPTYPTPGKFRANKYVATALLARLCLYTNEWSEAETYSTAVISSGAYILPTLANAFLETSSEAIWQLSIDGQTFNTMEGARFVPTSSGTAVPSYPLTSNLRLAFELGDQRFTTWIGTKTVSGIVHFFPNKYKSRGTVVTAKVEQPIVLRLGEQYLIRAEARAKQNNLTGAFEDLQSIRNRAGLTTTTSKTDQTLILNAIMRERRVELFAEYGHRWFDLKRIDGLDAALSYKTEWQSMDRLFPIPQSEILLNPNLSQNLGYQ